MNHADTITIRFPAPSDGMETVLVLFGIGALFVAVLGTFRHWDRITSVLSKYPWKRASKAANLLSLVALVTLGPVAAGLFVLALAAAAAILLHAIFDLGLDAPRTGFGTGAVIVALIGAPFVIWRAVVAQKTVNVTEQGHITERINTAVQGLGAEKEVKRDGADSTDPNLEVRIGAIYALERIAQDSDRDHVQIMEILCAYIRQNAPAPQADDWPELEMKPGEDDGPLAADWADRLEAFREAQAERKTKLKPREDIQVALTVIGRRSETQRRLEAGRGVAAPFPFDREPPDYAGPEDGHDPAAMDAYLKNFEEWQETLRAYDGYRLDLRKADLRGADLSGLNFNGARLDFTFFQWADFMGARLQGAGLRKARLQGARLWVARLQGAMLWEARLPADLMGARLQGVNLDVARFDSETNLCAASLRGAAARSVDFTGMPEIADHLAGMFGDGSVTLPEGCDRPAHWPRRALHPLQFQEEWRAWQADPEGYAPPDKAGG
jgi:hypothetical protein